MTESWPFTDRSAIRRVNAEGVLLLGGGRALLMQLAHPLVARGVAEHSDYRRDRIGRLLRTLRPVYAIAFGTPAQGREAAARVNAVHELVRGEGYRAKDPALLAWVLATLIDSALLVHDRFVRRLSEEETQHYYEDMLQLGALFATPRHALPGDVPGFRQYVEEMVGGLVVTEEARTIADQLFEPLAGTGPLLPFAREVTAGLLPPSLRRQYGMRWDPARAALLDVAASISRGLVPLLPQQLRWPPWFLMPPREHVS